MPIPTSTWKKHTSLLLSRLRSKRAATGGSSLVVQAGFPTSLADLFVKNHKKIKILPRKHSISRPANPNPDPDPLLPQPTAVRSPSRTVEINRSTGGIRPRRPGLGLAFLVAGLLAVGKRWVVVGITILSLLLLVVELSGVLLEKNKKKLESVDRSVDLRGRGLVSPIREESRCSDSLSDAFSERSELSAERRDFDGVLSSGSDAFLGRRGALGQESDVLVERRELDGDRRLENPTKKKRKKKKLFGKLFRRKCSRKKDENEESSPCLEEEGVVDGCGDDIEEFLSFGDSDGVDSEEVVPVGGNVDGKTRTRLWRWRKLVFFVVILFGLLGGKVVAIALTLACVLTSACTGTVWRRWKSE